MIKIIIHDFKTKLTSESKLRDGDFTIIATEPCTVKDMRYMPNGNVLIEVVNFQHYEETQKNGKG